MVAWVLDLADPRWDVDREARCLTAAEGARAARGLPAVRRRRVLLRAGLRRVLGAELAVDPDQVPLADDAGRPVLATRARRQLQFSCSASGDTGIVAVAGGVSLGVDVEQCRPEDADRARAEGWLAVGEARAIGSLPAGDRSLALTRCWTQKEAVLKGEGVGLARCPDTVVTPVADRGRVERWWLLPLPVPDGYVASLALAADAAPAAVPVRSLVAGGAR